MEFDAVSIVLSLIFSTFGLIYFRYGKRLARVSYISIGVVLMVYPYFVSSRIWMTVIGVVLLLIPRTIWVS